MTPHTQASLAIEPAQLTQVVRLALGSSTAVVDEWQVQAAGPSWGSATAGVFLINGTARDSGVVVPWSVVLKILRPAANHGIPPSLDETHPLYWKREALAYTSGLLNDLPGGIRAPRCIAHQDHTDGSLWLWLEQAHDPYGQSWPLAQYAQAARCLGRFNGAYLAGQPLPTQRWLGTPGALRGLLDAYAWLEGVLGDPATWRHPLIAAHFAPNSAERMLRMWANRNSLIDVLDRMPLTLCHKDAFRKNMFLPDGATERLMLIDWAYVGHGEVGLDLADLFGASCVSFCVDGLNLPQLDGTIFDAYLSGLHDAGWHGDPRMVRFSYTASVALKYGGLQFWIADLANGREPTTWETLYGQPLTILIDQRAATISYLLDLADEAHALRQYVAT